MKVIIGWIMMSIVFAALIAAVRMCMDTWWETFTIIGGAIFITLWIVIAIIFITA